MLLILEWNAGNVQIAFDATHTHMKTDYRYVYKSLHFSATESKLNVKTIFQTCIINKIKQNVYANVISELILSTSTQTNGDHLLHSICAATTCNILACHTNETCG